MPEDASTGDEPIYHPLSGWVFDRDGFPISGVLVAATARRLLSPPGSDGASSLAKRALTDASGAFFFDRLLDGEYDVATSETEMYRRSSATVRAGVDSVVLTLDEKSSRLLRVHGTVESVRGGFVAGVRVEPLGHAARATQTDSLGNYALELPARHGRNQPIRFLKEGFRQSRLNVPSDPSGEPFLLNAVLKPVERTATVTGAVLGDDGLPVEFAGVQLYSARLSRSYSSSSDLDGRFSFAEVEVGDDYRLWVSPKARYEDYLQENVIVTSAGRELPVIVDTLTESRLSGQMTDPEGAPVPGYSLWLVTNHGAHPVPVRGDARGRFFVGAVSEGEVVFQTHAEPWLSASTSVDSDRTEQDVQLVLDVGSHVLGGTVVDEAETPIAGAQITLQWSHDAGQTKSRSRRQSVSDANGYFLFTQLGAGVHALSVRSPGHGSARLEHRVGSPEPVVVRLSQ